MQGAGFRLSDIGVKTFRLKGPQLEVGPQGVWVGWSGAGGLLRGFVVRLHLMRVAAWMC